MRQEQGEAVRYLQRTGPGGGPDFRRVLTRRGLLDRLGQSSSARRAEDAYDGGENDVPVGLGSGKDQNRPDDVPMGESADFGVLKKLSDKSPFLMVKRPRGDALRCSFSWQYDTYVWTLCSLVTRKRSLSWIGQFEGSETLYDNLKVAKHFTRPLEHTLRQFEGSETLCCLESDFKLVEDRC